MKAFGQPVTTRTGFDGTGEYDFEDNNLDVYNIHDYKQTDFYWGLNRDDEHYEKELKKPPHRRDKKWPSIKEFWETTEPREFRLHCQDNADWRKFKVWLKKTLDEVSLKETSCDDDLFKKYRDELDIDLGDSYDKEGVVNKKIGVFNFDFTYFMTPEELKKFPQDKLPEPLP